MYNLATLFAVIAALSEPEQTFRDQMEARKGRMSAERAPAAHPVLVDAEALERARKNIAETEWGKSWFESQRGLADYLVGQPAAYVEAMLSETTPWHSYGFTCPRCVGEKAQECAGLGLFAWDYRNPEIITCRFCGQTYPDPAYPETVELQCPRTGQTFYFYETEAERRHPEDKSGKYCYHWVGYPIHVSFSGIIRQQKASFMLSSVDALANAYVFTGEPRYAGIGVHLLKRAATCYRNWLYHDYWDTIADCDPLYAAWHDKALAPEWKRHLCTDAFAQDSADTAAMLQTYWGAGRLWPSTDSISTVVTLCRGYDLFHDAQDAAGNPLWTEAERAEVERNLIMEWVIGAEPFVGGEGRAEAHNNKTPYIYEAMAVAGKCLGLPQWVDVGLRGYERIRDQSFLCDGFSRESPSYTNMYLGPLVGLVETVQGYSWPETFPDRRGGVDLYGGDRKFRNMIEALLECVDGAGRYLPLSDSNAGSRPSSRIVETAIHRYPEQFAGTFAAYCAGATPTAFSVFHLESALLNADRTLELHEQLFPAWMTAFLRHGDGGESAVVAFPFSPPGGHRHLDNLAVHYADGARVILEDHGYVGDMPVNNWIRTTQSHNLVVVDNQPQAGKRAPNLVMMATTPVASVVEASSDAYPQCTMYRRLLALIKGPGNRTFLIDLFRVAGGKLHAYRVHSGLASSESKGGRLEFAGIDMPPEPPLPDVKASIERNDVFGLRDVRRLDNPPNLWQAVWTEESGQYRLWMAASADAVEASNGPGQLERDKPGRRVRYVDVLRTGDPVSSAFAAVHEPAAPDEQFVITRVEPGAVPAEAGPNALAMKIETNWGVYLFFSEFDRETEVFGATFQGRFGLLRVAPEGTAALCVESMRLRFDDVDYHSPESLWCCRVERTAENTLQTTAEIPPSFRETPSHCRRYVLIHDSERWTGYAASRITERDIECERFNLPPQVTECRLPAFYYMDSSAPGKAG